MPIKPKYVECDHCGSSVTDYDMVDDQVMCVYCREFYKYEFKRSHHPLWLIQMSIERLESLIDKNQTEHLRLSQLNDANYPYCQHKLNCDTRERRMTQIDEFNDQYYDLHRFMKQLYKIARHKNMVKDAEKIAKYFKNR